MALNLCVHVVLYIIAAKQWDFFTFLIDNSAVFISIHQDG
jgi:hypothetical protein